MTTVAVKTDAKMVQKILGHRIKSRRKYLRMDQYALSAKLSVSRSSVANIETGRQNVGIDLLVEIADALNCDLRDLLPKIR